MLKNVDLYECFEFLTLGFCVNSTFRLFLMTEFFALSDHPGIGENLNFLLSGFSIVLLTLMVLAVVTALGGKLFLLIPEQAQSS